MKENMNWFAKILPKQKRKMLKNLLFDYVNVDKQKAIENYKK